MIFSKEWEMPNSNTFEIKCIRKFIEKYNNPDIISVDPFANKNKIAKITNDINPEYNTDFNLDALDFLKTLDSESADLLLFDPPYSPRQVSECYKAMGRTVNMQTTQSTFWSNLKQEVSRIVKPGGVVLCFGWNSGGVGINHGFEMMEILLVSHGGWHNDTICTAERKFRQSLFGGPAIPDVV